MKSLSTRAVKTADPEAIHDMRVVIKRLNLVYDFLDEMKIADIKAMDEFRVLKRYFKSAGRLRDLQVQRSILDVYTRANGRNYMEFVRYLDGMEVRARDRFTTGKANFPGQEQKAVISYLLRSLKDLQGQAIHGLSVKFIKDRIRRIEGYYLKFDSGPRLHEIRKTIKQLRFFLEIYIESSSGEDLRAVRFDEIRKIEDLLGDWNDKMVFCRELERFMSNYRLMHGNSAHPDLEDLALQVAGDAGKETGNIQAELFALITNLSMSLIRLK